MTGLLALAISTALLLPGGAAQTGDTGRWTVVRDGIASGSAPVRTVGDETFVDALSMSDALRIDYHRDEGGRFVFSLPGAAAVFVPDGTFAQVGLEMIHFPLPAFQDGLRFFVPEQPFLDVLKTWLPGGVHVDSVARVVRVTPPATDVVRVDATESGDEWVWRFTLARTLGGRIDVSDTSHVALTVPSADLSGPMPEVAGDRALAPHLRWDAEAKRAVVETPRPIKLARLEGPDVTNTLTLRILMLGEDEEDSAPLAYGNRTLDETLAEAREKWKIDRIVIDAGHGGKDPGAIGRRRTKEKDIVLEIARLLRDEVQRRTNVDVVMTRDRDVFIPLGERTRIANAAGGKLFISIHCNANPSRRARGQETYFLSPARNERAMQVAMKENAVIKYEEQQQLYPDLTDETFILLAMAQSQFVRESERFAARIQDRMNERTGLRNRGVDQAGFYVLIGASMPAVLVETAFISNPTEENLLREDRFRRKLAAGIADAVIDFMKNPEG